MSIDRADALFAALEVDGQDAFSAQSITLPDFPHRRAYTKGLKLRRNDSLPSSGSADVS